MIQGLDEGDLLERRKVLVIDLGVERAERDKRLRDRERKYLVDANEK